MLASLFLAPLENVMFNLSTFAVLFQGHYYHWEAFVHEQEPCALWCRATEDPTIEIRIKPKTVDGLRCSLDSLSVCLDGQCQVSKKKEKEIGVVTFDLSA